MDIKNVDLFFSENRNPMWIYDPSDLSIKEVNQSALDLYGYSYDEMRSLSIADLRPENEVSKLKEFLEKKIKSEFSNSDVWKHKRKNGEHVFVKVLGTAVWHEGDQYRLVVAQDVTEKMDYQQKYEMLFENILDGIMLTNPNGDILHANKAACDILGMSEEEIINRGREGIVAKDEKLEHALEERSETGGFSGELTYIHKSGRHIPVEVSTSIFTNYAGEKRTSLIFRDITDRKESEKALYQEKRFTNITLKSLPGIFFVLNERGELIRWNDRSSEVFGLSNDQIDGRAAEEFVHADDKQVIREAISTVFEKGHTRVELKIHTAGDNTAIYDFIANRFHQNGDTFIVGSGVDITQQKKLQKLLQTSLEEEHSERVKAEGDRDKLSKMFEEAPTPKCLLEGPEMRFAIANKAYREMIGQEDIIDKRVTDVIPEVEKQGFVNLLNQVYEKGETYLGNAEPIYFDKDEGEQREYIFNFIYEPLLDDNGEVYGVFVEAMDISKQIAYQSELEESLKEKNTLLQEVHHRVKNNLAIVSSMMELQALESNDSSVTGPLRIGQQRIQAIASIHNLLYQSDTLSHLNFGDTVRKISVNLHDLYGSGDVISLELDIDSVNINVNQAIPCALILNELLTNAYKHAFQDRKNGMIIVDLSDDQDQVYLSITDNGIGIQDSVNISNASSLGFSLIKNLKLQLDADLDISSNGGTSCRLSFPKNEVKGIGSAIIY